VDDLIHGAFVMFAHGPFWRRIPGIALPIPAVSPNELSLPIKGGSGWIQSERFTIDAKAASATAEDVMRGPMMQALLMERFKLKIHREPAEIPGYELTVAKGGPKLQAAQPGNCIQQNPAGPPPDRAKGQPAPTPFCGSFGRSPNGAGVDSFGVTMPYLCLMLSMSMDGDVVDKTGLPGTYDIHLDMTLAELGFGLRGRHPATVPAEPSAGAANLPATDPGGTLIDAIRKLGLTLRPAKMRVDAIVIDHVERPTAN